MKILLTGSSGFVGGHIKQALDEAGHELVTPTHSEIDFNSVVTVDDWIPYLEGVDAVINAVGIIAEEKGQSFQKLHADTPISLFQACEQSGINRVVQVSALGADNKAFTPYQKTKLTADDFLRDLSLSWFVLRPSLIYGEGGASFKMFKALAKLPLISFPAGGKFEVQPVHISDLVATVIQCVKVDKDKAQKTIDIVGPSSMTIAEYIQTIRASMGKKKSMIIPVPMFLTMLSARIGQYIIPILHPDNMRMLEQGSTSDVVPLTSFLGRSPLALDDVLNEIIVDKL